MTNKELLKRYLPYATFVVDHFERIDGISKKELLTVAVEGVVLALKNKEVPASQLDDYVVVTIRELLHAYVAFVHQTGR